MMNNSKQTADESTRSTTSSKKILNGGWVDVQLRKISHQVHDMDLLHMQSMLMAKLLWFKMMNNNSKQTADYEM